MLWRVVLLCGIADLFDVPVLFVRGFAVGASRAGPWRRKPWARPGFWGKLEKWLPTSPRPASSPATPNTSKPGSPPTAATAIRCNRTGTGSMVARACPWANRAIIVRRLLGLESVLSIGFCGPTHDKRSWTFDLDPGGVDPVLKIPRLQDAYFARFPDYPKGITVPAIVDVPSGAVVTNDFPQMTLDLSTEWTAYHRDGAPQLYPEALRDEIDDVGKRIYTEINNGVYRCGFAGSQQAYDAAYDRLFTALDWVSDRLDNAAIPCRRHDHRSRCSVVHHIGPLRSRLPRTLQVQSEQAHRDAGVVGLRARPVPDAGFW